jgi:hypothetical protein
MAEESLTTEQKAFAVNMDLAKYGAFAEIGAGQEVARWFFRTGTGALRSNQRSHVYRQW